MVAFIQSLFDNASLAPHGYCLLWRPELIWLHVVSDSLIALAYYSIPLVLAAFVTKRPDVAFGWVFWAFAIFILACGTTHVFGIWTLFYPDYVVEGFVKALTALASVCTAIGLLPLLPKALALPSPAQLRAVNEELREQIRQRDEAVAALKRETAERQKIEEQLRQSQKLEAVGRLTAGIAHDFNNLLTIIVGNLDKAKRLAGGNANVNRCMDNAMLGVDRATTLVRQMLAFGRRQPLASAAVDVNQLISQTVDALQRTLGEKIRLITNLPAALPEVRCDPHELSAALLNVSLNARDAMPEGGNLVFASRVILPLERQQRSLPDGSYVELSISDTGCGMAPDAAARAFEPFFTTKPPGDGSGLGLSQVYGFACQSGGIAILDTVPGQGTTVRIILPQANPGCMNVLTAGRARAPSALPQEA